MQSGDPSDHGHTERLAVGPADEAWHLEDRTGFLESLGVAWYDLVLVYLEAVGASVLFGGVQAADETLWLATDVALIDCHPRVGDGAPIRLDAHARSWSVVKDAAVDAEVLILSGEPDLTAQLLVQSPRVEIAHSGRGGRRAFAGFVGEVLRRAQP